MLGTDDDGRREEWKKGSWPTGTLTIRVGWPIGGMNGNFWGFKLGVRSAKVILCVRSAASDAPDGENVNRDSGPKRVS